MRNLKSWAVGGSAALILAGGALYAPAASAETSSAAAASASLCDDAVLDSMEFFNHYQGDYNWHRARLQQYLDDAWQGSGAETAQRILQAINTHCPSS